VARDGIRADAVRLLPNAQSRSSDMSTVPTRAAESPEPDRPLEEDGYGPPGVSLRPRNGTQQATETPGTVVASASRA